MEKRYQVFVSSTYQDLIEARQEVMQALLELDCIPAGMELFPAADDDQWTLIKGVIDDCDYYIVIIGGRYGSLGPDGKSYTHMEYEYAVSQGKPIIAFLHKKPGKLPAEDCENKPGKLKSLDEFRKFAQKKMVKYWTTPENLGSVVSRSIIKLIKTNPAIGWVKADLLPSKESTDEILQLRKRIDTLQTEIDEQVSTAPKETAHLAQGDDEFEIHYSFKATDPDVYTSEDFGASFLATWSQIFAQVSPVMIAEATDRQLLVELNRMARNVNIDSLEADKNVPDYELEYFEVDGDDFNTIKVQLIALRLMAKSIKNRGVRDKSNHWMLTPYGESVMTQLRAIRKNGKGTTSPDPTLESVDIGKD
ncbi:MAG: hypothetical protein DRR42_16440 [Gammaproteobacteria bacterium]|nr:MAG: hypothetical protein DRR42_16440 [Gammaproteobacteria bacterium]